MNQKENGSSPARHEATAIDRPQHEGTMGTEAAQTDAGRASAAIVGLGVDRIGLHGERLQHIPNSVLEAKPCALISSAERTTIGAGASVSALLMREPVTVISWSSYIFRSSVSPSANAPTAATSAAKHGFRHAK